MNLLNFYRRKPKFHYGKTNENPEIPVKLNYGINLVHGNSRVSFVMNFIIHCIALKVKDINFGK